MDRHSSYIFIWLQLELCAMAVLLTKGGCPPASWGAGLPGEGRAGSRGGRRLRPLKLVAKALLSAGEASSRAGARPQVATSCLFLEVAAVASRRLPPRVSRARRVQVESEFRASGCQNVCVCL